MLCSFRSVTNMDLTVGIVFVIVFLVSYYIFSRPKNLPPGPVGFPIIGSALMLGKFRKQRAHKVLFEEAKKYGNVMGFYVGKRYLLVLSGFDAVHEALVKQADVFSDRLTNPLFRERSDNKTAAFSISDLSGKGILNHGFGDSWRAMRRFTLQSLRDFGVGKTSIEEKIFVELDVVTKAFQESEGRPFYTSDYLQKLIGNVLFGIVFGKRYDYDDPQFNMIRQMLTTIISGTGLLSVTNFLPRFLAKLVNKQTTIRNSAPKGLTLHLIETHVDIVNKVDPIQTAPVEAVYTGQSRPRSDGSYRHSGSDSDSQLNERRVNTIKEVLQYIQGEIDEHEATYDRNNIRDFLDIYLQTKEDGKQDNSYIDMPNMFRVILDLFVAGSETTYTTLDWSLLYMSEYPDIQTKCQQEIQEVFGDKPVQYSDRGKMPFLEATLQEVQRISTIVPLSVPHRTMKDTTLLGYNIPADALVIPNLYAVSNDTKYWNRPERFEPERFLNEHGKLKKQEAFIPFSTGPRICLGEPLAKMELFLVFTNLLQRFTFKRENESIKHSFESKPYQITNTPSPYKLRVFKRN